MSTHGYARLMKRRILVRDIVEGVENGEAIEDYPDYHLGSAVLVLEADATGQALHVVWGIERGTTEPAVIITAYQPDPNEWSPDFRSRRS